MNLNETNCIDLITRASNRKSSRIPRFLSNIVCNIRVNPLNDSNYQRNHKFWKKYLNLNAKESKIPVFRSKYSYDYNKRQNDQNSGQNNINVNEIESKSNTSSFDNFDDLKLNLRSKVEFSFPSNGWTQSEPIDCLKFVIAIIRRDISTDDKLKAIKQFRDQRLGIVGQNMDKYSDERVREWVDSGYISNSTSVGHNDDVFKPNEVIEPKVETPMSPTNPMISARVKEMVYPRRSFKNMRAMDLIALNSKYNSFNSDISMTSISSIESLLESRREDPEELLLALGFGYVPEDQTLNRIPQRFLESPSSAKGVNPENVYNTYGMKDIPSLSPSVSFPSTDLRERSYSSGRISDRFKKRFNSKESPTKTDLPEIITSSCGSLPQTDSILNAANRMFLDNQGKEDQPNQLSSKRLIIGTKSYKLDTDGDPLEFPKTPSPSPVIATPMPTTDAMDVSPIYANDEQILDINKDNNFSQFIKRNPFQRQNCVSSQELSFNESIMRSSMNDMSSELSSSTTTLIGTVISGTNEAPVDYSSDYCDTKMNAFVQTDRDLEEINCNKAVEAALIVAIQSLRLSLEFYRHQSLKLAKICAQKFSQLSDLVEEDLADVSKIHELRECIHKETVEMDVVLNRHLQLIHTRDIVDISFLSQAQVFTEAVKKVKRLLTEQKNLYSRLGFTECDNY